MKEETLYKGEKPLDKMSDKELTEYWTRRVEKFLLGQKIVKVESNINVDPPKGIKELEQKVVNKLTKQKGD